MKRMAHPRQRRKCQHCGGVYDVYASQVLHRGSKYCSRACMDAARAPRARVCKQCATSFIPKNPGTPGTGRFCCQKCWREYMHARQPRRFTFTCAVCGTRFERHASYIRKYGKAKHCSRACSDVGRRRDGTEGSRGPGWDKIAAAIRDRDGHACVHCGEAEPQKRKHAVDHIVPWILVKGRPEIANDPSNLATLCLRCHGMKTMSVEPRLLKGEFLAVRNFYGTAVMLQAMRTWAAVSPPLGEEFTRGRYKVTA